MIEPKKLIKGKLYEFRGVQMRYSHPCQYAVQARFAFIDSKGQRKELGILLVKRELLEVRELANN
ncbi:MAG: hypothetical protein KME55_27500 [Nostoc indistinguendum CM1-VF10]|jgi:hypothetical protein|nr:hypothetical protein [Nostoc indistinguendum CM1-VF10]